MASDHRCLGLLEEALALGVLQEHAGAGLADALQDLPRVLEVPDVEDGQVQLDVAWPSQKPQHTQRWHMTESPL